MRVAMKLLIAMLLCAVAADRALAGDSIVVIVNAKNPVYSLTSGDVRKIYEDRTLKWEDGMPITVYDLAINDPTREVFSQIVFGISSERLAEMWAHLKITNQAKNPPISIKNDYIVMKRVSAEEGAIGYISWNAIKGADIQGFKIVATLHAPLKD